MKTNEEKKVRQSKRTNRVVIQAVAVGIGIFGIGILIGLGVENSPCPPSHSCYHIPLLMMLLLPALTGCLLGYGYYRTFRQKKTKVNYEEEIW